jgi:hypothetical protein
VKSKWQKQKAKAISENAPHGNRYAKENGIRTLGNRIAINCLGNRTEAFITDIGIYKVMVHRKINRIGKAGKH